MNKAKITITLILIAGLLALIFALAIILVLVVTNDLLFWTGGTISLLAFTLSAFIFGVCLHKVANRIKKIWQ